jgi:hypothetical protein
VRYIWLLTLILLLPVNTSAQQRRGNDPRTNDRASGDRGAQQRHPEQKEQKTGAPTPAKPWWEQRQTPWWEKKQTPWWERDHLPSWEIQKQRAENRRDFKRHSGSGVIYVVPSYGYFPTTLPGTNQFGVTPPPPTQWVPPGPPEPPPAPAGVLRLEVEPRESLQIFIDGVYVGTPADLGDEIALTPGTRRIELRARGHKPMIFSAEIVDQRSITYRGSLDRDEAAPDPPAPAVVRPAPVSGNTTMYMIPGCYLGNVAPRASELRPGCDIARLTTLRP